MSNIDDAAAANNPPPPISPQHFADYCTAWAAGVGTATYSKQYAVDRCADYATGYGLVASIGEDAVQALMAAAFATARAP